MWNYLTVMMTSVVVDIAPSFAVARRWYVPGSAKRAAVTAWPLVKGIGFVFSNVTFAGPPY